MKTRTWQRVAARIVLLSFTTCSVGCGDGAYGQTPGTTTVTTVEPATNDAAAPPTTLQMQAPEPLGKEELRELVSPVALYPDVVLASLLPATTFPEQVHEAAEWIGDAKRIDTVPEDRDWDGSVVGMLQFPDVLRWLDENPAWTDQMGQAVTYQQGDVLDAIQDFRRATKDAGNLESNQYQTVRAEPDQDIRIEPARPDVVYVPSYDPAAATQPQPEEKSGINPWIAFGGGAVVGALGAWALYSIFDDDDDDDDDDYRRRRRPRRIRAYDNYYYTRGRRARAVDWQAQARDYRGRPDGWRKTRRLQHTTLKRDKALSAPKTRPRAVRREQRQERKAEKRVQRQDRKTEKRVQRQDRKTEKRVQRQERRQQKPAVRKQQRQKTRQEQQGRRQEKRQEQRQQVQQRREQRQEQRQQKKATKKQKRQDKRQQRQQAN